MSNMWPVNIKLQFPFQESSDELADRLDAPVTALLVRGNNNNTEAPSSSHPWEPLNLHPKFSDIYRRWQTYLLSGDGPLSLQDRHYIAIMVRTLFFSLSVSIYEDHSVSPSSLFISMSPYYYVSLS